MTLAPLADINSRFAIPGSLQFIAGQGGLTAADITCPLAAGRVYLHGAHITQWQPAGHEPVLFLSDAAVFSEGKAIRGGVPICHPWFGPASLGPRAGDPTAPAHGLVRVLPWEVQATSAGPDGSVTVALLLKSTPQTRAQWPFDFTVELRVTFGAALTMELRTCNTGTSPMPF